MASTDSGSTLLSDRRRALLAARIEKLRLGAQSDGPIVSAERRYDVDEPLSAGQARMWFGQQIDPESTSLNICVGFTLSGDLDGERLHRAALAVVARHDILRTRYRADDDGVPRQRVGTEIALTWSTHDLTASSEGERDARLDEIAHRDFGRAFDLSVDPPLALTLVRTAETEHVLILVAHHIAWDDDSWSIFFGDLAVAYRADAAPDVTSARMGAVQYLDVEVLGRPDSTVSDDADIEYWRAVLTDPPEPVELPGESGITTDASARSAQCTATIGESVLGAVVELGRACGATPFMVLLAAFDAVVHRYTGATDFLVAVPVVNRSAAAEGALGYFGNTVLLRPTVTGTESFRELVERTREDSVGAFAHQGVGLDRVVREVSPDRTAGLDALARVGFGARSGVGSGFTVDGVTSRRTALHSGVAQLPLGVMVEFDSGAVHLEVEYLVDVISEPLAAQLLSHLVQVIEVATARPDVPVRELDVLGEAGRAQVLTFSRGPRTDLASVHLSQLIEAQVRRTPSAPALVLDDRDISYAEFDARANRIAHWLISRGVGPEDLVGLSFGRSAEMVIAALAVLKTGAAYLPVDPTYPDDRKEYMIRDAAPVVLLTEADDIEAAAAGCSDAIPTDADRVRPLRLSNLAYVIYTSGSTGAPKGVPVEHRAIVEYLEWIQNEYRFGSDDALLQVASTSFDVSVGEMFGPLSGGARLVIPKPDGLQDLPYLTALLHDASITSMHFVPSLLGLFLMLPGVSEWKSLRRVPIGGEALPGELADKFKATFDAELHNFYGPTEATLAATRYRVDSPQGNRTVPIGTPKSNTEIYLLDGTLGLVPAGVIAEVYIGGSQLARGYLGRPGLTADRFVADPFTAGGRLYRTGDVARWNLGGDIEFVGRADEQVKIRGFRIELGEIQSAVAAHRSVAAAVVVVHESAAVGKTLVAYVVPAGDFDAAGIRASVSAALPEYMVPSAVVAIDDIPLTANGKLDRRALPEPDLSTGSSSRDAETPTEKALCALFAAALGRGRVGADDSFFDLGGHSLLATRLVAKLRGTFGVEVSIREAFDAPTPAGLARVIDAKVEAASHSRRPLLLAAERPDEIPLSYAQLRQWFLYRMEGANPTYNIPFAARIDGPIDIAALTAAVGDVVARHETLRTTYPDNGGRPRQVVHAPATVDVPVVELAVFGDPDAAIGEALADAARYCFELAEELPIRPRILRVDDSTHVLSVLVHHIAADEWSAPVLFGDLVAAYSARAAGSSPEWTELPLQYVDYALWQRQLLEAEDREGAAGTQTDYWRRALADLPDDTAVLRDRPRPALASNRGDTVPLTVSADVRRGLADLGRTCGASDFMVVQTAVAVLLAKLGAGIDIPLGAPIAGRGEAALTELVGFFVNTIVLRHDLSGDPTLRTALLRTRETALEAYAHEDLPFERIVDVLGPDRSLSRHPLFQVLVQVRESGQMTQVLAENADVPTRLTAILPDVDTAKFDLTFDFFEDGDNFGGGINFRTDLYDRSTIGPIAERLGRVLAAFAEAPDTRLHQLDLLGADERRNLVETWSVGTALPSTPTTVADLLEPSRTADPGAVAIVCGEDSVTYRDFHERTDRLAGVLAARGVEPETFAAIAVPRSIDMVVAVVAVLKAGGAFLPLDLRYPAERLEFMLTDAAPVCVITTSEVMGSLPSVESVPVLVLDHPELRTEVDSARFSAPTLRGDNPAYFLFTSGSTGKPKGVIGTHAAVANRVHWQPALFPVDAPDHRLAQGSLSFLDGGLELLAGLASSATLVLADDVQARDLNALARLVDEHPVAQVTAVASAVSALVDFEPDTVRTVARWVCSGEPLTDSLLSRLTAAAPGSEIVNSYGTTETAGAIVRGVVTDGRLRVGTPVPGVRILLLDDTLSPVPTGVVGEIFVAGPQLSRGYWKRADLTASRFVADPFTANGGRLYRTGDRGLWNSDGILEFAGRTDHQVKVRGFRIELGEVENALRAAPGVAIAAARTHELVGAVSLHGYVVAIDAAQPEFDEATFLADVRRHLSTALPGYMTPSTVTRLDVMPTTGSGKLDRLSLPAPTVTTTARSEPPATDTERRLAELVGQVLGVDAVGRDDDFFALGGDSILSIQLAARGRDGGLMLRPQMIFEHSTVAELAAACDAAAADTSAVVPDEVSAPMSASGLGDDALAALKASWGTGR